MKHIAVKLGWYILTALISGLIALGAFFVTKRVLTYSQKNTANKAMIAPQFDSRDAVTYSPVLGRVLDTSSDMTVNAVLSGGLGPAVVMIHAEWCRHCTDMMPAYDEAAAKSSVPFIRIQGAAAPVTSAKHKVLGFPTIIAISHDGKISRFNDLRTAEKLLEFGNRQAAVPAPEQIEIVVHQPTAEVHQVPPSIKPVSEAPDALVL
jgi:thioredoxin-like negative regulator of GroEL